MCRNMHEPWEIVLSEISQMQKDTRYRDSMDRWDQIHRVRNGDCLGMVMREWGRVCTVCRTVKIYLMPLNDTLKMAKWEFLCYVHSTTVEKNCLTDAGTGC